MLPHLYLQFLCLCEVPIACKVCLAPPFPSSAPPLMTTKRPPPLDRPCNRTWVPIWVCNLWTCIHVRMHVRHRTRPVRLILLIFTCRFGFGDIHQPTYQRRLRWEVLGVIEAKVAWLEMLVLCCVGCVSETSSGGVGWEMCRDREGWRSGAARCTTTRHKVHVSARNREPSSLQTYEMGALRSSSSWTYARLFCHEKVRSLEWIPQSTS